ncbi:MAG: CCA tRNA nucleotidyltransferase [Lachnospiraceae bacterium]|nr:CCA tRNA nucleotidyltransferase [Lachnospiraceae bacterium]
MQIQLPEKVEYIINTLEAAGYEAYAVGGCVRDSLLNREPDDWDITTSARPQQVKDVFPRTIDTGIQHGTVTVMMGKEGFEVTTYRIDGEYEDSRHPKEVIFTANLIEDLKRRDFTINAFAYNHRSGIVDAFDGMTDLQNGIIRCVGEAKERFTEDALRMMRAVRFSAQLGYDIEEKTKEAIVELAPNLKNISAERIQVELVKLLQSPHPDYLRVAYELGMTKVIMPEFDKAMETPQNNPHHMYNVGEHLLHTLLEVRPDRSLRIAALLHDIAKPDTETKDNGGISHFHGHAEAGEERAAVILRRLKFDNDTINKVKKYVKYHDYKIEATPRAVRRALNKIGKEYFYEVLELKQADMLAQSTYQREEKEENLRQVTALYKEILQKQECVSLKELAVTGKDIIELGVPQGKQLGAVLQSLLEEVLENPQHNTREYLSEKVKQMIAEGLNSGL